MSHSRENPRDEDAEEGRDQTRGHSHAMSPVPNPKRPLAHSDVRMNGAMTRKKVPGQAPPTAHWAPRQGPAPYCSASLKNW